MTFEIKNICCIGAGYVGGPTMAVIAEKCPHLNINVVDINQQRIDLWNSNDFSNLPIYEPGLSEIIKKCRNKNLFFSTRIEEQISSADMIFISVNTPTKKKGKGAGRASDLKWVDASARQIAKFAKGHTIIVEKSTLPIKTAETIKKILKTKKKNLNYNSTESIEEKTFEILSNPEFLSEGTAINDLKDPDRILIGGEDNDAIDSLIKIYSHWVEKEKILTTNLWSAELSKLIANAFLAQRISSINSITALCEKTGANISEVSLAIGTDKRIGKHFLNASPGFGGSCFKKDISNLVYICESYGLYETAQYWQKVIDINGWQKKRITNIIIEKLFGTISQKKIAILGFSFKANTNDTRESPAIEICKELLEEGCNINIYDPKVNASQIEIDLDQKQTPNSNFDCLEGGWALSESILECVKEADGLVIMTEWQEFKKINWEEVANVMRSPAWLFDTRLISNSKEAEYAGLNVWQLGFAN